VIPASQNGLVVCSSKKQRGSIAETKTLGVLSEKFVDTQLRKTDQEKRMSKEGRQRGGMRGERLQQRGDRYSKIGKKKEGEACC